ncbi:MAG TPA: hydantoinase/oxoprolinase family protein [Hyphomicrobiaceae bacterium]|nr:hydantoinase/oxoprolinase family protein [Hyphomicrobiaceae bacterium]
MADGNDAPARAYRIGIDVGGTFTKAVLVDNATREVVGRYSVPTTHRHARGVAAGVVEVFRNVLAQSGVAPDEVVFLAHSTTQATNALLEGDVAPVGVIGMSGQAAAALAEAQVKVAPIELAPGRKLATANRFLVADGLSEADVRTAIDGLKAEGATVLVASSAFGVDNTGDEELVRRVGAEAGLMTTCGHEITRLYGLAVRTRTAVINASILPRMIATAGMTEESVHEAGITAPLMIMRGDGGVMDIREMRRRPVMTMLSGPAASVAGALMHLRVSDGIYCEVGGTSTNVGVVRNGRPTVTYARVGGHETYVSSLDVRVVGIAGGSLIRAEQGRLIDVGPRSAHIAGLPYAAFADPAAIADPAVELFEPMTGDGGDWIAVRVANGTRYALTTTCAANVLGLAKPGDHAHGNREAARKAFAPLAELLGVGVEEAARAVLDMATDKVIPVIQSLIKEYQLDADQCLLIGEGGGAASLIPRLSERTSLAHEISKDAEVISSIGVALALVREVVERIVPHPKPEDLQAIRKEALDAVVRLGADARSVDVTVEVDKLTHRVRAIAMGAAEMHVKDPGGSIPEREARSIAAKSLGQAPDALRLAAATSGLRVFQAPQADGAVRAVDWQGSIRLQRSRALVRSTDPRTARAALVALWKEASGIAGERQGVPAIVLLFERHVIDLSGVETLAQAEALAASELEGLADGVAVALVAVPLG